MSDKKRRHHYVWQHYLKPWLVDEKIYCLRDNNTFLTSTVNIGQQRDFYKLKELSSEDIDFIKQIAIAPAQKHLAMLHSNLLKNFDAVFKIQSIVKNNEIDDPEISRALDIAIHNLEEELHCSVEGVGEKYLQLLYQEDTGFWSNEDDIMHFVYFLSVQYMRTKKIKANLCSQFDGMLLERTERIWNVLAHMFATNVAWSFFADRVSCSLILLKNETSLNFIAGDQPCININASPNLTDEPPTRIALYYPISPKLAILLQDEISVSQVQYVEEKEVEKYNALIYANSYEQIYAQTKSDLMPFEKPK